MTEGNNDAWVRIYSEIYEDCIVGNKEGLLLLKKSIDDSISEKSSSPSYTTDFVSIVCTEESWEKAEESEIPAWQDFLFKAILAVWLVILPIIGIGLSIYWFL